MENRCLNIGCGSRFNPGWINIDIHPVDNTILTCDIIKGLPFENDYFNVVYHSHIIEHIEKKRAQPFLIECFRVLKPGGILRVVTPDLEEIVKIYLSCLQKACDGTPGWDENYDWIMLEMYDQVVREKSGGEIVDYLTREEVPNIGFILQRWGAEARSIIDNSLQKKVVNEQNPNTKYIRTPKLKNSRIRLKNINFRAMFRDWVLGLLLGEQYKRYRTKIDFLSSGERHRWMYDRYSLRRLLENTGFTNYGVMQANKSNIENWEMTGLDTDENGNIYKPDSIFVEAYKPLL